MEQELRDMNLPQEAELDTVFENPNGLPLSKIESIGKKWNQEWQSASNQLLLNWEDNKVIYKEFESKAEKGVTGKVPEVWSQLQTEIPHLINSIFSRSEIVRNFPKYIDNNNNTTKIKLYVNSTLLNASKARYKVSDTIQNFLIYGTAIVKTFWDLTSEFDYDRSISDWVESERGKPNFQNVNNFDFAVDPTYKGHDVNLAPWCRERVYYTKEEMKRMKQSGEIDNFEDHDLKTSSEKQNSRGGGYKDANKNKVFVDEFWADLYWEEEDPITSEMIQMKDSFFFWILNDSKVIKFKKNWFKFKPFLVTRCYRISDEFFGQGDVDIMKAYADQMSSIHAKAGVLAKRVGGKLTMYTPASGFSKKDAKTMENGLVMVDDLNQIKSENTTAGQDLGQLLNYKNSIKNDIQTATGINDVIQGEPSGDQTATEASLRQQNASARLTGKLQNIQTEIIGPLGEHYFKMSKQFIEEYVFNYKGQMVNLTQEDFEGDYDWQAIGSVSQSNKALQIKQKTELAMNLVQVAQSAEMVKAAGFDLMKFIQNEILPNFDIIDAEQYFPEVIPPDINPQAQAGGQDMLGQAPINMGNPTKISETIPTTTDIEANASNVLGDM